MIGGVGFFHFVANRWKDPLGSLRQQLSTEPRLERRLKDLSGRDFLIVLPECFNFEGDYKNRNLEPKIPASDALRQLADLCGEYRIVFVTGALDEVKKVNSAYLVDADLGPPQWRLLCHKRDPDGTERYTCCPDEPTNCGNPTHWKGAYVGALICVDVQRSMLTMAKRLAECKCGSPSVLCIPAWVNAASGLFPDQEQRVGLPGAYHVLANSDPNGCQSFITNRQGDKVAKSGREQNVLSVRTWAELDTMTI